MIAAAKEYPVDDAPTELRWSKRNEVDGFYRVVRFPDLDDDIRGCAAPKGNATHPAIMLRSSSGDSDGPIYAQGQPGELFVGLMEGGGNYCEAGTIGDEPLNPLRRRPE